MYYSLTHLILVTLCLLYWLLEILLVQKITLWSLIPFDITPDCNTLSPSEMMRRSIIVDDISVTLVCSSMICLKPNKLRKLLSEFFKVESWVSFVSFTICTLVHVHVCCLPVCSSHMSCLFMFDESHSVYIVLDFKSLRWLIFHWAPVCFS